MASRGKGARQKGAQFERDIANYLTEVLGTEFKRGLAQTRGGGEETADVNTDYPLHRQLHFELKRQKRCNIKQAYKQALEDNKKGGLNVIITKEDREDTLVTMELNQFLEIFKPWFESNKK